MAIQRATARLVAVRTAAVSQIPEWETLRQTAHDLRLHTLDHLDEYIAQVERHVAEAGGHVHHARDAAEANAIVVEIAKRNQVKTVVKGKSMASEEIGLNHALDQAGVRAVETDVGEFIIQLAGVPPSHILGPAMHMTKEEIAALFAQKLGVDAPPNPRALTDIARAQLRETPEVLYPSVRAFNRWLEEDWGYGRDRRIYGAHHTVYAADPQALSATVLPNFKSPRH